MMGLGHLQGHHVCLLGHMQRCFKFIYHLGHLQRCSKFICLSSWRGSMKSLSLTENYFSMRELHVYQSRKRVSDCSSESNQQKIIELIKTKKAHHEACYIVRQDAADILVKHLKKDLKEGDVIAEANPGPGILTRTILDQTVHNVVGYEPVSDYLQYLNLGMNEYASRLELHKLDLCKFLLYYTMNHESEQEGKSDRLIQLLKPLQRKKQHDSSVRIAMSLRNQRLIHNLSLSYTFQCCLFEDLFPIMYVYIPSDILKFLTPGKILKWSTPFTYYFDVEHLETAPYTSFCGRGLSSKHKNKDFHLVKILAKEDFYEIVAKHELPAFHFFMKHLRHGKGGEPFINYCEKWIPDCGIEYIKNGFRTHMKNCELNKEELLTVFRIFVNLPSYKESAFLQLCENWTRDYVCKKDKKTLKMATEDS